MGSSPPFSCERQTEGPFVEAARTSRLPKSLSSDRSNRLREACEVRWKYMFASETRLVGRDDDLALCHVDEMSPCGDCRQGQGCTGEGDVIRDAFHDD